MQTMLKLIPRKFYKYDEIDMEKEIKMGRGFDILIIILNTKGGLDFLLF